MSSLISYEGEEFCGKSALITGANVGIGRAIALAIAAKGGSVTLVARNEERLAQAARQIQQEGGNSIAIPCDLRRDEDMEKAVSQHLQHWGGIDMLVHAAGVWHTEERAFIGVPLADTTVEEIDEVMSVGLRAPILLTRLVLPTLIEQKSGKILAISGTFIGGAAGWLHYYVSKLALEQFIIGLSQELREHEIQANCISPSDTKTESLQRFFPEDAKTALLPEEVAKLAVFLLSQDADHITGQQIVIKNKAVHTALPPNHTV